MNSDRACFDLYRIGWDVRANLFPSMAIVLPSSDKQLDET